MYYSGTRHDDDQPVHLVISDLDICNQRCVQEFGNPCQHFCPAKVYEMVEEAGGKQLHINFANCVHCKTLRRDGPLPDHHLGSAGGRGADRITMGCEVASDLLLRLELFIQILFWPKR